MSTQNKNYTSSSEFEQEDRVQITNEIPLTRNYEMMHHSLQNDTWKWLIGTEDVEWDLPYNEATKTVNGVKAKVYGDQPKQVWDPATKSYVTSSPTGRQMNITGVMASEHDLFLHEIYRYFHCIYPDHPDWLNLLTRNEILDIIDNAAAQVDYKPNNEFFKIVADSLDVLNVDEEELKLNIRNLTSNAERRKYYGSIMGYRMYMHDVLENVLVLPVERVYPFEAVDSTNPDVDTVEIDKIDERYSSSFRKIDWIGRTSDLSFLDPEEINISGYILPDKPNIILEYVSGKSGQYTLSDYKLYNSDEKYSFYTLTSKDEDVRGSVSDTYQSSIINEVDRGLYITPESSDDKIYGFTSASNREVYYNTAYKLISLKDLVALMEKYDMESELSTYLPPYKDNVLTTDADSNWLFNLIYVILRKIDSSELMTDFSYVYNPFVKDTIVLSLDEMLKMYDNDVSFDSTGTVINKSYSDVSIDKLIINEGDLISFTNYEKEGSTPYKVMGGSYGYINVSITPAATADEYTAVTSYEPFNIKNDEAISNDNYGVVITTSSNSKIVMYGQLQFSWLDIGNYVYANSAKLYIRAIPEKKSDKMFSYLYDQDGSYEKATLEINAQITKLQKDLVNQREVLISQLYSKKMIEEEAAQKILNDYEAGELEDKSIVTELPSYESYKDTLDKIDDLKNDLKTYEDEKEELCQNRSLVLDENLVSNITLGNEVDFFQLGSDGSVNKLSYIKDVGAVSFISFGNISVCPVYPGETTSSLEYPIFGNKTITFCQANRKNKVYDAVNQQLYSDIREEDVDVVFKPTIELTMYNETTFDVTTQVYVDKNSFEPVYEIQFLSDDAKKKFDSLSVGSTVTGIGIQANTYVVSKGNYTAVLNNTLPASGYISLTFSCPVVSSADTVLNDPFFYKRLIYNKGIYKTRSVFNTGFYGSNIWPAVTKTVICEDEHTEPEILNPTSFVTVVKHLYGDKTSSTNPYLLPSLVKNSNELFIEMNARRLLHKENHFGDDLTLCNVEWLDYIQNNLAELGLAKEEVNVGFNVTMSTDISGYASLVNPSYTDEDIRLSFQTINWSGSIPAYAQIGNGGSGMTSLFKLMSDINYPTLYGVSFYDKAVSNTTDDEGNVTTNWVESDEKTAVNRRSIYSRSDSSNIGESIDYTIYKSIDKPLFEIPLNEYNITLDYNKFTIIDLSFYEQSFNNILQSDQLNVVKEVSLSSNLLQGSYRPVTSIKNPPLQDDNNNNYYFFSDGTEQNLGDFYFFDSTASGDDRFVKYEVLCGGCTGKIPYYKNGSMFYQTITSYFTKAYSKDLEKVSNFKKSMSLNGNVSDSNLSYDNILKRILVIKTIFMLSDDSTVTLQYDATFKDASEVKYISTADLIKSNKLIFRNRLILFTYYTGLFDKDSQDIFGLKDFDIVGLLWNKNTKGLTDSDESYDIDLVRLNKNYILCSNDIASKIDTLSTAEYNTFFGYNQYPLYKANDDGTEFSVLDLSNTIYNYSNNVIQTINLPRKFINEGSYDINIILDPKFLATGYKYDDDGVAPTTEEVQYDVSQSPMYYDSVNNTFYTYAKTYGKKEGESDKYFSEDDIKIAVNFEENKYFKNLKIFYGEYNVDTSQKDGSTVVQETPYIKGILNENFDVTDVKNRDKFVYAEEVKLRNPYMSSLESILFKTSMQFDGEIVGIKKDGSLVIVGKRDSRGFDNEFLAFLDKIYPAERSGNSFVKKDLGSDIVYSDLSIEEPSVIDYTILTSKSSSYNSQPVQDFKYFKNLLVVEGEINLSSPSVIEAPLDNDSLFTSALDHINSGDQIVDIVALNSAGTSTHTVTTNIKEKCKYLCYNNYRLLAITSSGKTYEADASVLNSASNINFIENSDYSPDSSNEMLEMMYDESLGSWVASYGLSAKEQGTDFYSNKYWTDTVIKDLEGSSVYDRDFMTTNPAMFTKKSDDSAVMVYSGKYVTVNDSISQNRITAVAKLKPEDVALCEYNEEGATESDKDKYGDLYVDKGTYAYVIKAKEGPYQVESSADQEHMYERLFSDGDISAVIMQDYLFVNTRCYKVDDDGDYTNQLTISKHWKAVKVPLLLDNTRIKLESMPVDGTNSAYDYVKDSFTEFCSWALDTATKNSDGTYSFSGLELKDKFTQAELNDYKTALTYVRDNLLTYENFVKKIEYYYGSIQITEDIGLSSKPVSKVRVSTDLPLGQNLYVNSKTSYVIETTSSDVIIRSKAYGNIVNKEALYYDYLYAALVYIRGDKEYDSFGAASVSEMFSSVDKLYFRTFNGDILYINKTNLYKASDIEDSTNWNVSLMPAGSYMYAWQDRDKIGSYETVLSNIGSKIPVNSKETRAYFFRTESKTFICPDGKHIFIGGYSYSLDTIADKYNTLKGNEEAFDKTADWVKNLTSSWLNGRSGATGTYPFIMYSDDGGETFKVLPVIDYIDSSVFNSNSKFTVDYFTYDSVTGSVLGFVKNGNAYESSQIVISFDGASGDVAPAATQYKQMSLAPSGDIHTFDCDDGTVTYAAGVLGYGSDNVSSTTFNFDYTGGTGVTAPSKVQIVSADEAIKLNKGLSTDATSGRVRVLMSIYTSDDIDDPFEYISSDGAILSDYIRSNGSFKVSLVQEVNSYKNADRVYSPAYFVDDDNVYPKVEDDTNAKYYEYTNVSLDDKGDREENYSVKYLENDFENNVKLCTDTGDSLLLDGYTYSYYDIITSSLSESDFDIAGKPKYSADELTDLTDAMIEDLSFKNLKSRLWKKQNMTIKSYSTDTNELSLRFGDSNNLENFLSLFGISDVDDVNNEDKTGSSEESDYTDDKDISSSLAQFIVNNEGDWGSTENPFSSFDDRFEYVNGYLFDKKYDAYAINLRYFISSTVNLSYPFYNGGSGIITLPKANFSYQNEDEEDEYLNSSLGVVTGVYFNKQGYGGQRDLSDEEYSITSPWDRDPIAFTDKLLRNSIGDFVYLYDKNGDKIKVYNATTLAQTDTLNINYSTFNSKGENIITEDNGLTTYKYYRLQDTPIVEYHSTDVIFPGMKMILRFYKNLHTITDVQVGDAGAGVGIIVNDKNEPIMKAKIEKSNGVVYMVTDYRDDTKSCEHTSTSDVMYCKFNLSYTTPTNHKTYTTEVISEFKLINYQVPFIESVDDDKTYFFKEISSDYMYLFNPDVYDASTMTKTYTFRCDNVSYDFKKEIAELSTDLEENANKIAVLKAAAAANMLTLNAGKFTSSSSDVKIETEVTKNTIKVMLEIPTNKYNEISIMYNNITIFSIPMVKVDYDVVREMEVFTTSSGGESSKQTKVYVGNEEFSGVIDNLLSASSSSVSSLYITEDCHTYKESINETETVTHDTYNAVVSLDTSIDLPVTIGSVITGLYDYSIVRAPKYATFYDLISNEGTFIKTGNVLSDSQLNDLQVKSTDSSYSKIELLSKINDSSYNDYKPHYFMFKLLTAASQYVAPENMNKSDYYKELTINEFKQFSADRVWYNPKGAPQSPIVVGKKILNSDSNSSFYTTKYTNLKGDYIYICDEDGKYIAYNSNLVSYRLDENLDGDCSSNVYPGVDRRIVSYTPTNELCVDWFKNNMYVEGNEINPFWQVIHIKPEIENKKWACKVKLCKFTKKDNQQVLEDAPDYPIVNIKNIRYIDTSENYIKFISNGNSFSSVDGKISLLLTEGTNEYVAYFNNVNGMTMNGLNFFPDKISDMFSINSDQMTIDANIISSYTVNSKRDDISLSKDNAIVKITEMGLFDKSHNLVAYAQFPPIEYRSDTQHLSFICAIYNGNMTEVKS